MQHSNRCMWVGEQSWREFSVYASTCKNLRRTFIWPFMSQVYARRKDLSRCHGLVLNWIEEWEGCAQKGGMLYWYTVWGVIAIYVTGQRQHRTVLVFFTHCGPCKLEPPSLPENVNYLGRWNMQDLKVKFPHGITLLERNFLSLRTISRPWIYDLIVYCNSRLLHGAEGSHQRQQCTTF